MKRVGVGLFAGLVALSVPATSSAAEPWKQIRETIVDLRAEASPESALAVLDAVDPAQFESHAALRRERDDLRALLVDMVANAELRAAVTVGDSLAGEFFTAYTGRTYPEALEAAERRVDVLAPHFASTDPEMVDARLDVATGQFLNRRRPEAIAVFEAVLVEQDEHGNLHRHAAEAAGNLGYLLQTAEDLDGAEKYARRALSLLAELGENRGLIHDASLNNLALVLDARGLHGEAEIIQRDLLARARAEFGPRSSRVAQAQNTLGTTLFHQGDLPAARDAFTQALEIRTELLGEEHLDVATAANNLAATADLLDDLEEGERLKRLALGIRRAKLGAEHRHVARTHVNLGINLRRQGRTEEAAAEIELGLELLRRMEMANEREYARALMALSAVREDTGDLVGARSALERGYEIYRTELGEFHRHVAVGLRSLARVDLAAGRPVVAESLLVQAVASYEGARQRAGTAVKQETFAASPEWELALARLELDRADAAWEPMERARARLLAGLLIHAKDRGLPAARAAERQALRAAWMDAEAEAVALRESPADETEEAAAERVARGETAEQTLLAAEAEWIAFERRLEVDFPRVAGSPATPAQVAAKIPAGGALVGWLEASTAAGDGLAWGWVLRSDGDVRWERLPWIGAATGERGLVERVREDFELAASWPLRLTETAAIGQRLRQLADARLAPLARHLENVSSLIVVPSGSMLGLPVEALPFGEATVADGFDVSYAPSATIYAWLAERPHALEATGALIVGNPELDASWAELPAAEREVELVAAALPSADTWTGAAATEEQFVRRAEAGDLAGVGVLHFATHALADTDRPDRSALILGASGGLAAVLAGERTYDGRLTAAEIVRSLKTDADLVTLSGCGTGRGRAVRGEGYLGLAHAFFEVGARSLVLSLWNVEDEATARLMDRFYRELAAGQTRAGALRTARIALRDDPSGDFVHPAYWAGFVLLGAAQ